ncbi:MAG: hypothetical protein WC824_02920 [Bacteroidota bacterium]
MFDPAAVELDIAFAQRLLIARVPVDGFGLYGSAIDSDKWEPIGEGLPVETLVGDVCCDSRGSRIYVSSAMRCLPVLTLESPLRGVFESPIPTDRKFSWAEIEMRNSEVSLPYIASIKTDPASGDLHICTPQGLFRRSHRGWIRELSKHYMRDIHFEIGGEQRAVAVSTDSIYLSRDSRWYPVKNVPWHKYALVRNVAFLNGEIFVSTVDGIFVMKSGDARFSSIPCISELP